MRLGLRRWWVKAALQSVVARLPDRLAQPVNSRLQALGSGGAALSERTVAARLDQAAHHCAMWSRFGDGRSPRVLEMGTGWYPLVPFAMYLGGAATIDSFDVLPLTTPERVRLAAGAVAAVADRSADPDRVELLRALAAGTDDSTRAILGEIGIRFRTGVVDSASVEPATYDIVVSDNTLEHVPLPALRTLLAATQRALRPGGVADHFVDGSDHLAHFDRGISEYHFLRWEPRAWALINNRLLFQNRLREADYRAEFERVGLTVVASEWTPGRAADLTRLPLAAEFRSRPLAELLPVRGYVSGLRPAHG